MHRFSKLALWGLALYALNPLRAWSDDPKTDIPSPTQVLDSEISDSAMLTSAIPVPADAHSLLDSLLANPDNRTENIRALLQLGDEGLQGLFQNLFKGNVYEYTAEEGAKPVLVIGGPEEDRDEETWVPLLSVYPMKPMLDKDGNQIFDKLVDLVELDIDREVRSLIQPVLTAMDLKSPDISKRKSAVLALGESGDTLQTKILKATLEKEPDSGVRHLIEEALARIDLKSNDPALRLAAAEKLGEIHSVNVLPELQALMVKQPDGKTLEPDSKVQAALTKAITNIESYQSFTGAVQNLFTGLSLGSILILMALGLAIIFGLMGVINMAHGEFMMIGAYATFLVQGAFQKYLPIAYLDWFLPLSLPIAFLTAGGVGILVEMLIIKRLYGRPLETLLATWGLSLLFIQTARSIFGDLTAVSTPNLLSKGWEIFPQVVLPYNRIFIMGLTVVIVLAVGWAFYRTSLGMKIRAVTQNRPMSSCLGIATRRVDALTFGLGTGIAGVAGCALTQIGNVDPSMGQNYIVDSFMVVVTGGVGKLAGTVISGMSIGTLNKFLEPFLQSVYAKVVLLGLVILFLQNRPSGLFPAKGRNEDT
jgi:urea transport system permease protein